MIEIKNSECLDILKSMPNNSIDFVCIDPPYTDGKGNNVLAGHKIQTKLDLQMIANELYRVAKPNTFTVKFDLFDLFRAIREKIPNFSFELCSALKYIIRIKADTK